jgi:hypothetical protein
MALIKLGPMVAEARGSIGGTVFSRNAAGAYARNKSIPVQPNSAQQIAVRSRMTDLTQAWTGTLTGLQRISWGLYGDNVPVLNKVGDSINLNGLAWYIACNSLRLQIPTARVDDGPFDYTRAEQDPTLSLSASEATQELTIGFDDTLGWATEDDAWLMLFASRPQNTTIQYFKGPFRYMAAAAGNSAGAPVTPVVLPAPFPFAAGNRLYVKGVILRADGRTSTPFIINALAVA